MRHLKVSSNYMPRTAELLHDVWTSYRELLHLDPCSWNLQLQGVLQNGVVNVPRNCWERTLNIVWSSNIQNGTFGKITITVAKVALIQVSFHNVGSKQKIKLYTRNTMAYSYHSKVRSTQIICVLLLQYKISRFR